jgi:hypothetical protein
LYPSSLLAVGTGEEPMGGTRIQMDSKGSGLLLFAFEPGVAGLFSSYMIRFLPRYTSKVQIIIIIIIMQQSAAVSAL